jgi:hypothetical protein
MQIVPGSNRRSYDVRGTDRLVVGIQPLRGRLLEIIMNISPVAQHSPTFIGETVVVVVEPTTTQLTDILT